MKIVCDACSSKYSIADDRIAGKVFKIRCKKCSNVIVIRGAVAEVPVAVATDEWHLVVDGEQRGPFERAELVRRHAAGELDDESLIWRDGMEEWASFASIAELAAHTTRVVNPDADAAMFATSTPPSNVASTSSASEPDADKKLLAERNESSVLFTLGNLAKLASTESRPAKDAAKNTANEGSGLIDIRALASTFAKPGAAKPASTVGSLDDLPTFGPSTFGEPIVFVPPPRQRVDRRMIYALCATLAMLAIVGGVLLVVILRDPAPTPRAATEPPATRVASLTDDLTSTTGTPATDATGSTSGTTTTSASTSGTGTTGTAATSNTVGTTPGTNTATRPGTTSTTTRPATTTTRPAARPGTSSTTTRPGSTSTTTRPGTSSTITSSTTSTTTRPGSTPAAPDRVQCEFSNFADKGCEIYKPATSTTTASNLPENLDRTAIATGLGTIRAQACGGRSSSRGDVAVQIKVNADGGVSGVTVKSSPDEALSACVVAAAQKGKFAKTKRGASFGYVWRF